MDDTIKFRLRVRLRNITGEYLQTESIRKGDVGAVS